MENSGWFHTNDFNILKLLIRQNVCASGIEVGKETNAGALKITYLLIIHFIHYAFIHVYKFI